MANFLPPMFSPSSTAAATGATGGLPNGRATGSGPGFAQAMQQQLLARAPQAAALRPTPLAVTGPATAAAAPSPKAAAEPSEPTARADTDGSRPNAAAMVLGAGPASKAPATSTASATASEAAATQAEPGADALDAAAVDPFASTAGWAAAQRSRTGKPSAATRPAANAPTPARTPAADKDEPVPDSTRASAGRTKPAPLTGPASSASQEGPADAQAWAAAQGASRALPTGGTGPDGLPPATSAAAGADHAPAVATAAAWTQGAEASAGLPVGAESRLPAGPTPLAGAKADHLSGHLSDQMTDRTAENTTDNPAGAAADARAAAAGQGLPAAPSGLAADGPHQSPLANRPLTGADRPPLHGAPADPAQPEARHLASAAALPTDARPGPFSARAPGAGATAQSAPLDAVAGADAAAQAPSDSAATLSGPDTPRDAAEPSPVDSAAAGIPITDPALMATQAPNHHTAGGPQRPAPADATATAAAQHTGDAALAAARGPSARAMAGDGASRAGARAGTSTGEATERPGANARRDRLDMTDAHDADEAPYPTGAEGAARPDTSPRRAAAERDAATWLQPRPGDGQANTWAGATANAGPATARGNAAAAGASPNPAQAPIATTATGTDWASLAQALGAGAGSSIPAGPSSAHAALPLLGRIDVPIDQPDFGLALGAQVSLLARDGVHEARLDLHPAEMGPITVQITVDGSQARVDFQAEVAATRSALEASIPALASTLQEAGLTLSGGGVFQQSPQGQSSAQAGDGGQRRQPEPDRGQQAPGQPATPADATTGRSLGARRGLVDLIA